MTSLLRYKAQGAPALSVQRTQWRGDNQGERGAAGLQAGGDGRVKRRDAPRLWARCRPGLATMERTATMLVAGPDVDPRWS